MPYNLSKQNVVRILTELGFDMAVMVDCESYFYTLFDFKLHPCLGKKEFSVWAQAQKSDQSDNYSLTIKSRVPDFNPLFEYDNGSYISQWLAGTMYVSNVSEKAHFLTKLQISANLTPPGQVPDVNDLLENPQMFQNFVALLKLEMQFELTFFDPNKDMAKNQLYQIEKNHIETITAAIKQLCTCNVDFNLAKESFSLSFNREETLNDFLGCFTAVLGKTGLMEEELFFRFEYKNRQPSSNYLSRAELMVPSYKSTFESYDLLEQTGTVSFLEYVLGAVPIIEKASKSLDIFKALSNPDSTLLTIFGVGSLFCFRYFVIDQVLAKQVSAFCVEFQEGYSVINKVTVRNVNSKECFNIETDYLSVVEVVSKLMANLTKAQLEY